MDDLLISMREYLHETEETNRLLNMHCQSIKTSLHRLQRRNELELLLKEEEKNKMEDEFCGLNDIQMDEIDILIKKAERVFVDDISTTRDTKKNKKRVIDKSKTATNCNMSNPPQKSSSKVDFRTKQRSTTLSLKVSNRDGSAIKKPDMKNEKRKGFTEQRSGFAQKTKRSGTQVRKESTREKFLTELNFESLKNDQKLLSTGEKSSEKEKTKISHEGMKESKILQPALPPLYDPAFLVEYCNARKQKKELSKLQNDRVVVQQNKAAIAEFMSSLQQGSDDAKVDTELDMSTIAKLLHSGLTEVQRNEMLESIHDVRRTAYDTVYGKMPDRKLGLANNSNNISSDLKPLSTVEMKRSLKLMQLKYNVTVSEKIRSIFENEFSKEGCDVEITVSQFRHLYYLVNGRFPSFVKNE